MVVFDLETCISGICFVWIFEPNLQLSVEGGLKFGARNGSTSSKQDNWLIFELKTMGKKDASTARTPVDQYRKQIGKQDYKKTRPMLRATRLKAEAKKTALGVKEVALVLAAILVLLLAFYAFFYLNISSEVDLDLDPDEN
ncbi:triple QxxK/R motif-containing protein [Lagopus muta]|uniref:triple QxxK/R motif-containing protein n=1 Tax=Lagopus muta TaxID=64668 RepID=UPI00209DA6C9|nr:triple QxxK/R motif-containing protein [Lagopus muta]